MHILEAAWRAGPSGCCWLGVSWVLRTLMKVLQGDLGRGGNLLKICFFFFFFVQTSSPTPLQMSKNFFFWKTPRHTRLQTCLWLQNKTNQLNSTQTLTNVTVSDIARVDVSGRCGFKSSFGLVRRGCVRTESRPKAPHYSIYRTTNDIRAILKTTSPSTHIHQWKSKHDFKHFCHISHTARAHNYTHFWFSGEKWDLISHVSFLHKVFSLSPWFEVVIHIYTFF